MDFNDDDGQDPAYFFMQAVNILAEDIGYTMCKVALGAALILSAIGTYEYYKSERDLNIKKVEVVAPSYQTIDNKIK